MSGVNFKAYALKAMVVDQSFPNKQYARERDREKNRKEENGRGLSYIYKERPIKPIGP